MIINRIELLVAGAGKVGDKKLVTPGEFGGKVAIFAGKMEVSQPKAYSIGEFTQYIKHRLEGDNLLMDIWVEGEISNLTRHGSGHVYFSLKDEGAQVNCAMFKGTAIRYYRDLPKHGEKILARGRVSVYPPRGGYQLIISELRKSGLGDLHQRFLELRDSLRAEGLFEPQNKQAIPAYPKVIGVATSPTGAVIRDIMDTIRRRYPHVKVVLMPTKVQGPGAAEGIVRSLEALNQVPGMDTIIIARGGGSMEDLWCFNEEIVARAIFASKVPVISGVGHETDTTITDFVADLRASTPTAAAEQAIPDAEGIRQWLAQSEQKMKNQLQYFIDFRRQMLDDYARRLQTSMEGKIKDTHKELDDLALQLRTTLENKIVKIRHELDLHESRLASLDLREVLGRGFSITRVDGKVVKSTTKLEKGGKIESIFADGKAISTIDEIKEHE